MKAFIFEKTGKFLGSIPWDEAVWKNDLARKLTKEPLSLFREENGILFSEEIEKNNKNYFWAVVEDLRAREFRVFPFDEEKEEIAELLLNSDLEDIERLEFFTNLLSVPSSELKKLKEGIQADLADLR